MWPREKLLGPLFVGIMHVFVRNLQIWDAGGQIIIAIHCISLQLLIAIATGSSVFVMHSVWNAAT